MREGRWYVRSPREETCMSEALPGHPEAIPGASTPVDDALSGASPTLPKWLDEPVRLISNVVAGALAFFAALSALVVWAADVAPESMRDEIGVVSTGILAIVAVLTKAAGVFTRDKV